ncbi:MAG TPA: outer membrane lipid asymmetry maintenance protein MlaD [Geminicoccus sp.]|jgi:phospholipid/cholesterol/gamma-HCH transport system substrate-binding protein|uniref:outer membrane lipid asymmetry maintenance protein MlaD n=1 Tax=Geminicoccus sp. TaxID=2024832 RepID=UPI002E379A25|nr:outer membrane lipid asymmetry maintenance protein MlaD [Geminicoccus sp.]HEX2527789.1 outer membrane lipid asymmetry maintenance protein MlaD [Geminicoccus sp.]
MARSIVETVLGALVLLVACGFLVWAYGRSNLGSPNGYELIARFDRADGIEVGADARISGVKIGTVTAKTLDPQTFRAEVRFSVQNDIKLPSDSSASVASASLIGGKYLSIVPGGDEKELGPGGVITLTQSSISIEDLIGRYIFSQGGSAQGGSGGGAASGAAGGEQKPADDIFSTP